MKNVVVIGSNGKSGRLIVEELVNRGFDVTGISHGNENKSQAQHYVSKDLFDLTKEDVAHADVVVSAFGTWTEGTLPLHVKVVNHISDLLSGTDKRFLVVGGAGSLYVDDAHTVQLLNTTEFPVQFRPLAQAQTDALEQLRKRDDVRWTFVSPAADFQADGERAGRYILAGEKFTVNSRGESVLSYADYAIAFADEIEKGNHIRERISVLGE